MVKMSKNKENTFKDVIAKFKARDNQPAFEIKPDALNELWGQFHLGTIYAMWSEAGGGKTTLCLQVIRSLLHQGKSGLFVDVEKALNAAQQEAFKVKEYVDTGQLTVVTLSNYKDLEELVLALPESELDFVVIDSVTAVRPYAKDEIRVEDSRFGVSAMQQALVLNKLKDIAYDNQIGVILVAHARANIQLTPYINRYAPTSKMAGGYAMYHIPDVITEISMHSRVKDDDDNVIGVEISMQTTKNKWCAPFKPIREKLFFGKGISTRMSLIEKAIEAGIIKKEGRFLYVPNSDVKYNHKSIYGVSDEVLQQIKDVLKSEE